METPEIQVISGKEKGFAWGATLFVSRCCIFTCVALVQFTGAFRELFRGMGVEIPLTTRFLIATYPWLYPLLYIGAAVLVIAKEFVLRDMRRRLATTGSVFFDSNRFSRTGAVRSVLATA
jgi:hypothetical protein